MRYMFSLFGEEGGWQDTSPEDMKAEMDRWEAFGREAVEAGVMVAGDALQESDTATTLRIQQQAEPIVSDGPFAETKEQLGGYYVLDCKDLDEALAWARKIPLSSGAIEVRPVMDYTQFGYNDPLHSEEASRAG
ncbi:MAG TPA: YciI family protein [Thermoleophilaceae bacterium]|jgi:hypothetical protein|nr:YciI family protein [Thermoleophilaceae bacterium]